MKNPLTREAFCDWVRQQPPEKTFEYWDNRGCAGAMYAESIGLDKHVCALPPKMMRDVNHIVAVVATTVREPKTFGELQNRMDYSLKLLQEFYAKFI